MTILSKVLSYNYIISKSEYLLIMLGYPMRFHFLSLLLLLLPVNLYAEKKDLSDRNLLYQTLSPQSQYDALSEAVTMDKELMGIPTFESLKRKDIEGKNVLVRVNVNVKVIDGRVAQDVRLRNIKEVVQKILENGGTPILLGHNGRLEGEKDDRINFDSKDGEIIRDTLSKILEEEVVYHAGSVDDEKGLTLTKENIVKGKVNLLQNVRMAPGYEEHEKRNVFADQLAGLSDGIYINDSFGDIGSKGASTQNVVMKMNKVALGVSIAEELRKMEAISDLSFIYFGGSKLDKTETIENLLNRIRPGGCIIFGSRVSEYIRKDPKGQKMFFEILLKNNIHDVSHTDSILNPHKVNVAFALDFKEENHRAVDIGDESEKHYLRLVDLALKQGDGESILLNGTMGWIENPKYVQTTQDIVKALAEKVKLGAKIFLVGDDGPRSWKNYAKETLALPQVNNFTGGGVPLKYLSDGAEGLVALKALASQNALLKKENQITAGNKGAPQQSA